MADRKDPRSQPLTDEDRADVQLVLRNYVEWVLDEFADSPTPAGMYRPFEQFISGTANKVILSFQDSAEIEVDEPVYQAAMRVLARFPRR
jgi:hypothetical protein